MDFKPGERRQIIAKMYEEDPNFSRADLADELECSRPYISMVIGLYKKAKTKVDREKFHQRAEDLRAAVKLGRPLPPKDAYGSTTAEVIEEMDNIQIETKGREIRTAEGAMEYCGVDPNEWNIVKKVVNFWDMGEHRNWQVKVWLSRRNEVDMDKTIERLIERVPGFMYKEYRPRSVDLDQRSGNLGIIANFDAHIGKLAWEVEIGHQGDYDLPIAERNFDYVTDENLYKMQPFNVEEIWFFIGQDMMHYENLEGVTPKGRNILDTDGRLSKLQDLAIDVCIRNIYKCRAVAKVRVILVQGNHDQTSSLWLSKVLRHHFKDDPYVTVDCEPKLRKAYLWGKTFIGMTHKIMPSKIPAAYQDFVTEFRELWGKAVYGEVLFGDQHKKNTWKVGSQITHGSMMFRQLTALSKIDYWHYENLFTDAVPGGEAFIINKDRGTIANFTEWTNHLE